MEEGHETLGENVIPTRYKLLFNTDLDSFRYTCEESIYADIRKKTSRITLNSSELKIKKAYVRAGKDTHSAKVINNEKKEEITLVLSQPINGAVEIGITAEGINNDKLYGFYRSRYGSVSEEKYILTTQFEAASARKAFPCFDEPSFKAVFDLSLLVDKDLKCVSNMPIKEERLVGDRKEVTFNTTPKMSTYLLYIGVGDFERVAEKSGSLEIGVITTPGKKQYTSLAMEYGKKSIQFFESYFGIRYPLPKLDLIAIPDFAAGAMENWGAVTFREIALLGNDQTPVMVKQRIADVIAHELAHQWFGDLVTMKWWNDLWLNESFATFMSTKATESIFPQWNTRLQYLEDVIGVAFAADQLASTHPISVNVRTPAEIDEIFDEISYEKGGTVLNMLESYAGKDTFRQGLNHYLREHSYGNAVKQDLWGAIDLAARKNGRKLSVSDVASCWVNKKGYPSVSVRRERGGIGLRQERFTLSNQNPGNEEWLIPVRYAQPKKKGDAQVLMRKRTQKIRMADPAWIKLNAGQTGMYRTIYPDDMLDRLGELIKGGELEWIDAWGIENDLYAITRSGRKSMVEYLDFIEEYCFAAKYPLNMSVLSHMQGIFSMLYGLDAEQKDRVSMMLREYSSEILKQMGWIRSDKESNITTMSRSRAILASGISGESSTLNKANKMFSKFTEGRAGIDPNLRGAVYSLVAWSNGQDTMEALRGRYLKEEVPDEKRRLLGAMGMFGKKDLVSKALAFSLSKDVRYQDSYVIAAVASSNPAGKGLLWNWTRSNWKTLMQRYSPGTHMLSRYVSNMSGISDPKMLDEIRAFFANKANKRGDISKALRQTTERIRINCAFMKANGIKI